MEEENELECDQCGMIFPLDEVGTNGLCITCNAPEADPDEEAFWDAMTAGCERSHRDREERE